MRIQGCGNGYTIWLSAQDTEDWARRPGASWPCSTLAGHRLRIEVDSNGLCNLSVDGRYGDVDGHELDACVADHLPAEYRHLWPVWGPAPAAGELSRTVGFMLGGC
jgi:hypothetical protein